MINKYLEGLFYIAIVVIVIILVFVLVNVRFNACKKQVDLGIYKNVFWCIREVIKNE